MELNPRTFPLDYRHGETTLGEAAGVSTPRLACLALDETLLGVDPRQVLFLDVETTGLAGGTGTIPFLIGVAYFSEGSLRAEQLLLDRPGREAPILRCLAERLRAASLLVTYNGKSFDLPLLRTRYVLNRLPVPTSLPHLDLLHCTRRVLRFAGTTARLADAEAALVGLRRTGDLDGRDIPPRYWQFVKSGDRGVLAPVLEHNLNDVLSLAALMVALVRGLAQPGGVSATLALGFAHLAMRHADPDAAVSHAQAALAKAADGGEHALAALRILAHAERRRGNFRAAAAALNELIASERPGSLQAAASHLAYAKLLEHRLKDRQAALAHARLARGAEPQSLHTRRLARLTSPGARGLESPAGSKLTNVGAAASTAFL